MNSKSDERLITIGTWAGIMRITFALMFATPLAAVLVSVNLFFALLVGIFITGLTKMTICQMWGVAGVCFLVEYILLLLAFNFARKKFRIG